MNTQKQEIFSLGWLDPRTKKVTQAGVAFFNSEYGEYFLKIDEEPSEKQYFLKPYALEAGQVIYRVELIIKNKKGKFIKRKEVGEGVSKSKPSSNVYINYGSKYKTLVLFLKEENTDENK